MSSPQHSPARAASSEPVLARAMRPVNYVVERFIPLSLIHI